MPLRLGSGPGDFTEQRLGQQVLALVGELVDDRLVQPVRGLFRELSADRMAALAYTKSIEILS